MKLLLAFLSCFLCMGALAASPDKLAAVAGPQPSENDARQAVLDELKKTIKEPADFSRVRFLSGPKLVTGTNHAQGREQAWMMCVIEGNSSPRREPMEVALKLYLLRNNEKGVVVIANPNWNEFDEKCQ